MTKRYGDAQWKVGVVLIVGMQLWASGAGERRQDEGGGRVVGARLFGAPRRTPGASPGGAFGACNRPPSPPLPATCKSQQKNARPRTNHVCETSKKCGLSRLKCDQRGDLHAVSRGCGRTIRRLAGRVDRGGRWHGSATAGRIQAAVDNRGIVESAARHGCSWADVTQMVVKADAREAQDHWRRAWRGTANRHVERVV